VSGATPATRSVCLDPIGGDELLRFAELHSHDPRDGSRIRSQYAAELSRSAEGAGALGVRACGDLVAVASYGTVRLPRPNAVSARIDVVVTTPHCRGRGLARVVIGGLLGHFLNRHGDHLEHVSVVAAHPTIQRIVERLGFVDAAFGTSSPVLHRALVGTPDRVSLRVESDRAQTQVLQALRTECTRCLRGLQPPWCGRAAYLR